MADETTQHVQHLEARLVSLQERIVRATELLCDEQIDKARYDALCARASEDADATQRELTRLRANELRPTLPPLDTVRKAAKGWATCFTSAEAAPQRPHYSQAQRDVLATLLERIVPVRVGHGKYRVDATWTPLGTALRAALKSGTIIAAWHCA